MNSKHDFLTFYHFSGRAENDSYRKSKGIVGYVHDARSTHTSFRIYYGEDKTFYFTGEVIKIAPDWISKFFDSNNYSLPILIYDGKKYESLLPQLDSTREEWYASLPKRCKYL